MKHPKKEATGFRLSRIYAEGWNAARTAGASGGVPINPYSTDPEQSRWQTGFSNAQGDPGSTYDAAPSLPQAHGKAAYGSLIPVKPQDHEASDRPAPATPVL